MTDWKNEDDIKAELRVLTDELKHLREELRDMVTPPKQRLARGLLHRQSWRPPSSEEPPRPEAHEVPRKPKTPR
jgi:hypothetical protein